MAHRAFVPQGRREEGIAHGTNAGRSFDRGHWNTGVFACVRHDARGTAMSVSIGKRVSFAMSGVRLFPAMT